MLRIKGSSLDASNRPEHNYVPLKQVHVDATIRSFAANVTITQVFRNDETKPIEAVYCFPIEEKAAIYSFVARIDDREIIAQLKEKKQAQQEYSHALQQGDGAYLLEQDDNSRDNFLINVGALPPSKECTIIIAYVTELEFSQGSTIRFVVPTTIAPRYNPNKGGIASPAGTNSKYIQSTPYTIQFQCRIDKMGRSEEEYITRINSPSHPIQVDFAQQNAYIITFAQQNTHLDRDILINIELSDKRATTIVAVESNAVMAVFTPREEDCRQELHSDQTNEFLFIIDCSGSMRDENKIGLARQAMLLFLKSLPMDCYFNIIRFGSNHDSLFAEITAIYNEENARKAEQLITRMEADLGGTELLKPLRWIEQQSTNKDRARQIFLLTDGEISNVTEVLDLCRSMASSTRIFSFGLGASPSRSLVKGLARSTHGRFVFIPPNSNVDIYVAEQLQYALQPCILNVDVQWNLGTNVQCAPTQSPPVYVNDRLVVYALTNDQSLVFDHHSSVLLKTKSNNHTLGIAKVDRIPNVVEDGTIARLAAKALILELQHTKTPSSTNARSGAGSTQPRFEEMITLKEETVQATSNEQRIKERIIELSLKYNILSPHTAFVGIEKRTNTSNAEMVLREVPIEISADDQHLQHSIAPLNINGALGRMAGKGARSGPGGSSRGRGAIPNRSFLMQNYSCIRRRMCSSPVMAYSQSQRASSSDLSSSIQTSYQLEYHSKRKRQSPSRETSPITSASNAIPQHEEVWPSNDEDVVRYLIKKQKYDGLWDLDTSMIMNLTGKPLSTFLATNTNVNAQIIFSVILVLLLETRFATLSSLWHGVVQKARKRIGTLVTNDSMNFETLAQDIRQQL